MSKIIFNYNLCDKAPECGGITVCPHGAIYFDSEKQKPVWEEDKCTFCLKCTTMDACPIGCILYARDAEEERKINAMIKEDKRTQQWLWQERYGVEPAKTDPKANILENKSIDEFLKMAAEKDFYFLDFWHEDALDCRLHAVLYEDLIGADKIGRVYKVDAKANSKISKHYNVSKFPTLLIIKAGDEIFRRQGYIENDDLSQLKKELMTLIDLA
jgi:NAD-dependent dihydropyrimidine dehydrogenase PreA subunit